MQKDQELRQARFDRAIKKDKKKEEDDQKKEENKQKLEKKKKESESRKKLRSKVKEKSEKVSSSLARAKKSLSQDYETITDKEGDLTAAGKLGSNVAKAGLGAAGAVYQLGKAAYEKSREYKYKKELGKMSPGEGTINQRLKYKLRGAALAGARKIGYSKGSKNDNSQSTTPTQQTSSKSSSAISKLKQGLRKASVLGARAIGPSSASRTAKAVSKFKRGVRAAALTGARRIGYTEEFLYEIDKASKEKKVEKIIDIMKGKNKVKVNPDIKEASFDINPKQLKSAQKQEKIRGMLKSPNENEAQVAAKKLRPSAAVDVPRFKKEEFEQIDEKCWPGYKKKGMKTMFGKRYPNCVKKEETVMIQDANGNDYIEFIDIIKPEPMKSTVKENMVLDLFKAAVKEKKRKNYLLNNKNITEVAAWQRKEGKNPSGGLNAKGRASAKAQGMNLKPPVTTPPSKLKPGSKSANRRKSFCARMGGNPGPMKDEKGRPTRKALALRKWNC